MHRTSLIVAAVLALGGCKDAAPDDSMNMNVTCGEEHMTYSAGMTLDGALWTFSLDSADPAPPDKGDNTWVVSVLDPASEEPAELAALSARPFMPEHGHGTSPELYDATDNADGAWTVGPMDLFMSGIWEVTLEATGPADSADEVTWTFCLEG